MTSFSHFTVTIDCVKFPIRIFPLYTYSMIQDRRGYRGGARGVVMFEKTGLI